MKRYAYLLAGAFFLYSCNSITGSGKIVTENRNIKNFTAISASNGIEVVIYTGDKTNVQVEGDDNVIEYVVTKVEGNRLKIRLRDINLSNANIKVIVTAPEINEINAGSSAAVLVKDLLKSSDKISLSASSSGEITAIVDAPEIKTDASSSGSVKVSGHTQTHRSEASSSGEVDGDELLSENTIADANSSGSVKVHASVSLSASASSSGTVQYRGAATVKSSTNSGGTIEKE
jgi:predicted phosphodiesterase